MMHFLDLMPVVNQHDCIEFLIDRLFFFHHFKHNTPLPFALRGFCWKFVDHLTEYPFFVMICFSLAAFMILFNFQQLDYMCLSVHLSLVYVEVGGLLVYVNPCFSSNLGRFWPLFLQIISLPLSHSLFLRHFHNVYIGVLMMSISPLGYVNLFHSFFSLLLILNNFKWPFLKFTNSFFCLLKAIAELL